MLDQGQCLPPKKTVKIRIKFRFQKRSKVREHSLKFARELHFALTEMSDDTADDRPPTPPSGPPELQKILSFREQQEVHPPYFSHPVFTLHRARTALPGILELCSRFSRV